MLQVPIVVRRGAEIGSSVQSVWDKSCVSGSCLLGLFSTRLYVCGWLCLRLFGKILLFCLQVVVLWLRCVSTEENQP